jgi:hypothetical protein
MLNAIFFRFTLSIKKTEIGKIITAFSHLTSIKKFAF